jgi:hypothetical protein
MVLRRLQPLGGPVSSVPLTSMTLRSTSMTRLPGVI